MASDLKLILHVNDELIVRVTEHLARQRCPDRPVCAPCRKLARGQAREVIAALVETAPSDLRKKEA